MDNALIEQSLTQYRRIAEMYGQIEQALQNRQMDTLASLCADMNILQEEIKGNDAAMLDLLRQSPALKKDERMRELVALMDKIRGQNNRLTVQLKNIMAVQRSELQKLQQGSTVLQGYRPASDHTGKRISVSN